AFGPRTSPTTTSGSARCSRSHATSTTAGRSDTGEELREDGVELVRPLEAREVAGLEDAQLRRRRRLGRRDERVARPDREEHRRLERGDDLRRVAAVADRLDGGDELVRPLRERQPTREGDR